MMRACRAAAEGGAVESLQEVAQRGIAPAQVGDPVTKRLRLLLVRAQAG